MIVPGSEKHTAEEALRALRATGYVVLPALLTPEDLESACTECECLQERLCSAQSSNLAEQLSERGCILETTPEYFGHACVDASAYRELRTIWPCSQAICQLLTDGPIGQLAQAMLGPSACIYNDQYIVKPPRCPASAFQWHFGSQWLPDNVHVASYISIWIALDDMNAENGCLEVVPTPSAWPSSSSSINPPERPLDTEAIALTLKAGDAVVMTDKLWHFSGPNRSLHFRRAWMPQYSMRPIMAQNTNQPYALAIPLCSGHGEPQV